MTMKRIRYFFSLVLIITSLALTVFGQQRGGRGGAPQPPQTARAAAVVDFTGYWVSVVTEDWRFRMFTPRKGDYQGLPLNQAARQLADAWDSAKDEASGEQCRSYGAANIMRVPARFHITWADDRTLKIESDAGMQTRLIRFSPMAAAPAPSRQGSSIAEWGGRAAFPGGPPARSGFLKVVTTRLSLKVTTSHLKAGYLRKNGVPYSANAVVTEYFDQVTERNGDVYLIVTTTVEDPTYLTQPYYTSTNFRKQVNAAGWNPSQCTSQ